jgi:hypothetical protein
MLRKAQKTLAVVACHKQLVLERAPSNKHHTHHVAEGDGVKNVQQCSSHSG